jgi:hypothetical protein
MTWILDLIDHQTGFKNYNPKTTCLLDGPSMRLELAWQLKISYYKVINSLEKSI